MSRPCQVCALPSEQLAALERSALEGVGHPALAAEYGVSHFAIARHMKRHLPVEMAETLAAERLRARDGLMEFLQEHLVEAQRFHRDMYEKGEYAVAAKALDATTRAAHVLGRVMGYVRGDRTVINVGTIMTQIEQGQRILSLILPAIGDDPALKQRLAEVLVAVGDGNGDGVAEVDPLLRDAGFS